VTRNRDSISTLDLFGGNFTLLSGSDGDAWSEAAREAAPVVGVDVDVHSIGEPAFPEAYGITPTGAVLIRPDGFVAWRAKTAEGASAEAIGRALHTVLCRP